MREAESAMRLTPESGAGVARPGPEAGCDCHRGRGEAGHGGARHHRGDTWSQLHMMSAVTRSDLGQHEVMEMTSYRCSLKG